jgi:hypothetical protein
MIIRNIKILAIVAAMVGAAQAQLSTSLALSKRQYLTGEPVIASVTITNHAGQDLTFASDGRNQWLDFIINNRNGDMVNLRNNTLFGKMTIKAGESLSREVNLSQYFMLGESGNFSVSAVVHMPGSSTDGSSTNRVFFAQSNGSTYWSQKVGIPGTPKKTRTFKLITFIGDTKNQIYAQIIDDHTGQNIRTFLLGDVIMMNKPLVAIDRQQRMHVLFLASPTMWAHCEIDTDGKLCNREIHQRGAQGDPGLLTFGDGTVSVSNSIPYNEKAAAAAKAKIRKASERPTLTY